MKYMLKPSPLWAAFILLAFASCANEGEKKAKEIIRPVKYMKVSLSKGDTLRSFSGMSKAGMTSRASFRVGGKIESIKVKDGDNVKKNAFLASLDNSDATLQYEKSLSSFNKSKVYRKTAKSNLSRVKSLYENNNVSLSEYEAAKEKYANSNAVYLADKRNADLQKKELGYYKLYSPMAGVISGVSVEAGENISPGQVILEILSMDKIEVMAGIPDAFITHIKKGGDVNVEFTPVKGKVFAGKITEVSYNVDEDSSTYPVTVSVINPSEEIRPGMSAYIVFNFSDKKSGGIIFAPVHSVGKDNSGNFVYVVKKTEKGMGIVEKREVIIGKMTGNGFEILKGLENGELVVTAGISHLTHGLKVKIP